MFWFCPLLSLALPSPLSQPAYIRSLRVQRNNHRCRQMHDLTSQKQCKSLSGVFVLWPFRTVSADVECVLDARGYLAFVSYAWVAMHICNCLKGECNSSRHIGLSRTAFADASKCGVVWCDVCAVPRLEIDEPQRLLRNCWERSQSVGFVLACAALK